MSHQKKPNFMLVIVTVLALVAVGASLDVSRVLAQQEVCPQNENGWTSHQSGGSITASYDAPEGKLIVGWCYKAGTTLVFNDPDPIDPPVKSINLSSTVLNPQNNNYQQISHFSVRLIDEQKEETPTPTPTSTEPTKEETPTPTPTSTEPVKEETPSPTPTSTATGSPKESTPTATPEPTDPPQPQPTPDEPAGGNGPSLGSLLTLLMIAASGIGLVTYLAGKVRNSENLVK